jgi:hypothetical protein
VSGEAAFKVGVQLEFSFVAMVDGPDKGEYGVLVGGNFLAGLEGGVTAAAQFFYPANGSDLRLANMSGLETGVQGDAFLHAASVFHGFEFKFQSPFKVGAFGQLLIRKPYLYSPIYNGWSLGMSGGIFPASGSAYIGASEFIYRSSKN